MKMKLFTLIFATCLLVSSASSAQTASFINSTENSVKSIKFNPLGIANGVMQVKMYNQPVGSYTVSIVDENGNVTASKVIIHNGGTTIETADFGMAFAGGSYQVQVVSPDNQITNETFLLLI